MSRNGSGTYNLPAGNPVVTGTTISSSWANTTLNDIATALTGSLAADGQTPVTANFNVNNNRITNLADPSSAQDGATKAYVDAADTTNLGLSLLKASNLSDVANATTARGNLTAAKSGANSDITSLTGLTTPLSVAQGGTGLSSTPSNGQLNIGNGTGFTRATLTAGSGISVTNGAGTVTIAATGGSGTVTSVATGNGLSGGTITSSGTLTVACPTFNTVGSYATVIKYLAGCGGITITSGSNYAAGSGINQFQSGGVGNNGTNNLSGTWKWMGCTFSCGCYANYAVGVACRVA